jgi:hypothetical protein
MFSRILSLKNLNKFLWNLFWYYNQTCLCKCRFDCYLSSTKCSLHKLRDRASIFMFSRQWLNIIVIYDVTPCSVEEIYQGLGQPAAFIFRKHMTVVRNLQHLPSGTADFISRNLQSLFPGTCSIYLQKPTVFIFKNLRQLSLGICSVYLQQPAAFIFSNLQHLSSGNCWLHRLDMRWTEQVLRKYW